MGGISLRLSGLRPFSTLPSLAPSRSLYYMAGAWKKQGGGRMRCLLHLPIPYPCSTCLLLPPHGRQAGFEISLCTLLPDSSLALPVASQHYLLLCFSMLF